MVIINEDFMNKDTGFNLQEFLDENMIKNKQVSWVMDWFYYLSASGLFAIYVWRTFVMCDFDKVPLWKPILSELCTGYHHNWYYNSLLVWHVYFLLEFMVRIASQKYKL